MIEVSPRLKTILEKELAEEAGGSEGGVTRVEAKAIYNLQLQTTADGFRLLSDEKHAKGGTDTGPAPIRFFLAGILMNLQVKFIKSATLIGVSLDSLEGDIAGHRRPRMDPDDGVTFEKITLELRIESSQPDAVIIRISEEAIKQCGSLNAVRIVPVAFKLSHNKKMILEKIFRSGIDEVVS